MAEVAGENAYSTENGDQCYLARPYPISTHPTAKERIDRKSQLRAREAGNSFHLNNPSKMQTTTDKTGMRKISWLLGA